MIRAALLLIALAPLPASAQSGFVFGQPPAATDTPRALDIFSHIEGYAEFTAERHGAVTQPLATELGTDLLLRIFRNTCLGIERGQSLAEITPNGFAPYETLPYSFGDVTAPLFTPGRRVLSPTGSIDADEGNGHPSIWLAPEETGMTCRIEWHIGPDVPEARQQSIANYLQQWVPWSFALIHASRPFAGGTPPLTSATEWDRPCGDRWCPMTIVHSFPAGRISIETTLNITDIEGSAP
ncbi:hypothetical protein KUL25_08570 [Rhodobacteraceae bacterium N5(2021)]|uniref:Uncharacterized protein n=1 Tax=Gymnodinialimonas phycosphaerae TaxID=2841589 RepID=A0A975YHL2_9RHOB|nr:hypothetical protein [Gymnodinialimonas phycosphaerae]MBY4892816.1 hypothetical protein [Gymnodinialimonas phycosphaerae]